MPNRCDGSNLVVTLYGADRVSKQTACPRCGRRVSVEKGSVEGPWPSATLRAHNAPYAQPWKR